MKLKMFVLLSVCALALLGSGCAPKTFVKTLEPTWGSVELREDVEYNRAWDMVVDTLVKRFDLEVLNKADGYARTNWLYSWTGKMNDAYRVRVTVKFTPDHRIIQLKSEAEYDSARGWIVGYDSRLLSTIKSDIMGTLGRTTR